MRCLTRCSPNVNSQCYVFFPASYTCSYLFGDIQNWLNGPVGRFLYSDGEDFDFKLLLCHPNVHSKVSIVMKNKWIWPRIQSPGDLTAIRGYKDTHTGWKNPRVWIWACVFFTSNDLKRFLNCIFFFQIHLWVTLK